MALGFEFLTIFIGVLNMSVKQSKGLALNA